MVSSSRLCLGDKGEKHRNLFQMRRRHIKFTIISAHVKCKKRFAEIFSKGLFLSPLVLVESSFGKAG